MQSHNVSQMYYLNILRDFINLAVEDVYSFDIDGKFFGIINFILKRIVFWR